MGKGHFGKILISSSSSKRMIGYEPNLARIICRGRGCKVVQVVHLVPMGGPGGGPPRAKIIQLI